MKNSNNDFNLFTIVNMVKVGTFYIVKLYKSTKKKTISQQISVPEIIVPDTKKTLLQRLLSSFFFNPNFWFYGSGIILSILILKEILDLSHGNQDLSNKNENPKKFPKIPVGVEKKPKKKILSLNLCSPFYVGQYVIFKQKNKNNVSSILINKGEIGKIIKQLDIWDFALVDFSIETPSNFKNWNTKLIADEASNEAILIVEGIKTEK